jgi:hypothetical protein
VAPSRRTTPSFDCRTVHTDGKPPADQTRQRHVVDETTVTTELAPTTGTQGAQTSVRPKSAAPPRRTTHQKPRAPSRPQTVSRDRRSAPRWLHHALDRPDIHSPKRAHTRYDDPDGKTLDPTNRITDACCRHRAEIHAPLPPEGDRRQPETALHRLAHEGRGSRQTCRRSSVHLDTRVRKPRSAADAPKGTPTEKRARPNRRRERLPCYLHQTRGPIPSHAPTPRFDHHGGRPGLSQDTLSRIMLPDARTEHCDTRTETQSPSAKPSDSRRPCGLSVWPE